MTVFSRIVLSFHPSILLLTRPERLGSPQILAQRLLSRSLGWYSLARLAVPPLPPHFQGGQVEEAGPAWDREKKGGLRRGSDLPAGPWHNSAGLLYPEPKLLFARETSAEAKFARSWVLQIRGLPEQLEITVSWVLLLIQMVRITMV